MAHCRHGSSKQPNKRLHDFRAPRKSCIICTMKNVTITVEDATLGWVRIEAARRNTSVSRLVGEMLTDKMQHDDAYARAQREWVADTSSFSSGGKVYPPREAANG
jgi:hypothetical protein